MPNKKGSILKIVAFVFFSVLVMSALFTLNSCSLVKRPDIVYHEFPMELTYEINGEVVVLKDIYVVEYIGLNPEIGHKYKGYMQSTEEDGFLLCEDAHIKVICQLGNPDYYVGIIKYEIEPRAYCKTESFFYGEEYSFLDETELYEQYGIKIISWSTSEPLESYYN